MSSSVVFLVFDTLSDNLVVSANDGFTHNLDNRNGPNTYIGAMKGRLVILQL